jgi:signal transduction histidine kinase
MGSDKKRLAQILLNLPNKAAKCIKGYRITMRTRRILHYGHERLEFRITDEGIDLPEPQMAKLFQPSPGTSAPCLVAISRPSHSMAGSVR